MLIVDAHLDLAYSALNFDRDLRQSLAAIRAREPDRLPSRGRATVSLPALRDAGVGLVFGTLFVAPADSRAATVGRGIVFRNAAEAHREAMAQLDYYHRLADELDWVRLVGDTAGLEEIVAAHAAANGRAVEGAEAAADGRLLGIVPLMEGATAIRQPEEAEVWYERGLRIIGLAWDDTPYAPGAWRGGGRLTADGYRLLEVMADLGFILDLTHMAEAATFDALDAYDGPVCATHCNARALVPGNRQLSDDQIRRLAERDGVIGVVLYNRFLRPDHALGDPKELVTLDHLTAHIDHICQVIGDADHVGIGSDFDGGFGADDIPAEMDSVLDLARLALALTGRGYSEEQVAAIMGENWLRFLRRAWG